MSLDVLADLTFSASVPRRVRGRRRRSLSRVRTDELTGRVQADGRLITVQFSRMPSWAVPSAGTWARTIAGHLDRQGLTLQVVGPDRGVVVELGHQARPPLWQLPLTRSRSIRLRSLRAGLRSLGGPRLFRVALPSRRVLGLDQERRTRAPVSR